MASDSRAGLQIVVTGRVQGVFFRVAAQKEAQRLGITGHARNLPDGSVEIIVEGNRSKLMQFAAWARHGPPRARVDSMREQWTEYTGGFSDFAVR
jgi:acylphosphatase